MDNPAVKEEDDELAALGGKTRLISRRSPGSNSQPSSPQPSSTHSMSPIDQPTTGSYMSPETPPSVGEPTSPVQTENTQWDSGYVAAADMYGYAYPPQDMNGWQHPQPQAQPQVPHDHPHLQMQNMPMHMEPVQYAQGYEHLAHSQAMAGHSHQYMPQSPVQISPQGHVQSSDPHASWNFLFAQFNQV